MIPFRRWIHQQTDRDDPIGDLAQDMKRDLYQRLPNPSLKSLYSYLRGRACDEALEALIDAYREWQVLGNTYRGTRDDRLQRRPSGWLTLRFRILRRDHYRCQLCGAGADDKTCLEVDHKLARVRGGTDDESNLWTLCFSCNRGKRDKLLYGDENR